MVMSTHGGDSCLGAGAESIDEHMREFISLEITCVILEKTPMIFSMVMEGIVELLDEHLGDFRPKIAVGHWGVLTLSHQEFKACGAPKFFGEEDVIDSSCFEGSKVGFSSCLRGDRLCDWIFIEVSRTIP